MIAHAWRTVHGERSVCAQSQARLQAEAARADTADATVASLSAELTSARLQGEVRPPSRVQGSGF